MTKVTPTAVPRGTGCFLCGQLYPSRAGQLLVGAQVVGLGFGLDAYGVGKFSGHQVLIRDKSDVSWKFRGDAPTVVSAWFRFLKSRGALIPNESYTVCGVQVHL